MSLTVNDVLISDATYQTKIQGADNVEEFGIYHDSSYNLEYDPLKQIVVSIDKLTRKVI